VGISLVSIWKECFKCRVSFAKNDLVPLVTVHTTREKHSGMLGWWSKFYKKAWNMHVNWAFSVATRSS